MLLFALPIEMLLMSMSDLDKLHANVVYDGHYWIMYLNAFLSVTEECFFVEN